MAPGTGPEGGEYDRPNGGLAGRADPATKTHMFEEAGEAAQVVRGQLRANRQDLVSR